MQNRIILVIEKSVSQEVIEQVGIFYSLGLTIKDSDSDKDVQRSIRCNSHLEKQQKYRKARK